MGKRTFPERAPYDINGNLLHQGVEFVVDPRYPDEDWSDPRIRWLPNNPWHGTLRLDRMQTAPSQKYVVFKHPNSTDQREYPMFVRDLVETVADAPRIEHGIISGRWIVRRLGNCYGIALAPDYLA